MFFSHSRTLSSFINFAAEVETDKPISPRTEIFFSKILNYSESRTVLKIPDKTLKINTENLRECRMLVKTNLILKISGNWDIFIYIVIIYIVLCFIVILHISLSIPRINFSILFCCLCSCLSFT